MDDRNTHEVDDDQDMYNELDDQNLDDDSTPADTNKDDPKKADAEEVRNQQKQAWLAKIKTGKASLDDMPNNLSWLKKDIEKEMKSEKSDIKPDVKSEIRQVLAEERAESEFEERVNSLKSADISAEQEADLREYYEDLIQEFKDPNAIQRLKILKVAQKMAGIKDADTHLKERKRKGMTLPPLGGNRETVKKKDQTPPIANLLKKKMGERGLKS